MSQAIRVGNLRIYWIDFSRPDFLAGEHLPPVELPLQRSPQEIAVLREEIASLHLFIEAEIDQFLLKEEGEVPDRPVELSNSKADFDKSFATHPPRLVVAWIDTSSEKEKETLGKALKI